MTPFEADTGGERRRRCSAHSTITNRAWWMVDMTFGPILIGAPAAGISRERLDEPYQASVQQGSTSCSAQWAHLEARDDECLGELWIARKRTFS